MGLKTDQIMYRDFNEVKIPQRTSDKFFNATEMLNYYNELTNSEKRFKDFWENKNTVEFLNALETEILNGDNSAHLKTYETKRGRGGSTWMHPYLFVKFCFWLSPTFELKVIKWVYDNLIDFRHEAGDHYKEMGDAIVATYSNWYGKYPDPFVFVKEANYLNLLVFGNPRGNQRNTATEFELMLMNKLQLLNINLILKSTDIKIRRQKLKDLADLLKLTDSKS